MILFQEKYDFVSREIEVILFWAILQILRKTLITIENKFLIVVHDQAHMLNLEIRRYLIAFTTSFPFT